MTAPAVPLDATSERRLRLLLPRVSRTFALGIKLLPVRLERPVRIGYLLCRIADTIEDDLELDAGRKAELLARFVAAFDDRGTRFDVMAAELTGLEDHRALVAAGSEVFGGYRALDPASQAILRRWVREMVSGMSHFVTLYPRGLRLASIAEFRSYCYFVAGTVGHLLTELWHAHSRAVTERVMERLLLDCEAFGEALQTVNILKDIAWDAEQENAIYVPADLLASRGSSQEHLLAKTQRAANRSALQPLIELARSDLERALAYIERIPLAAPRVRVFCSLPVLFAVATLRELEHSEAMLEPGGGVKISRREVKAIMLAAPPATVTNTSLRLLVARVRRREYRLPAP
ncbi:MAG: phytoene/squalene synthase family protein [Candidatus Velthaea sp.]|jgi:farnesyl-diphosphate farnesyltransferase